MAVTCGTGAISYYDSRWVAAWLPIRYQIASYLWPTNESDIIDSVTSVTNNFGFAQVTYTTPSYSDYEPGMWVELSGMTNDEYNGIWQIRDVGSGTLTLNLPYVSDDSGYVQKYYQNYQVLVRVYVGLPPGHVLETKRPMTLKATIKVTPNANNIAEVDIASIVRADLVPHTNDLCDVLDDDIAGDGVAGNDWHNWTAFYIQFAESWDAPDDDGKIVTHQSDWVTDIDEFGDTRYFYASNSVTQFQSLQGRSMEDYVIPIGAMPNNRPLAKFLTHWDTPVFFDGFEFDLAYISDGTTYAEYVVEEYDSSGSLVNTQQAAIVDAEEGLYRLGLHRLTYDSSTTEIKVKIYDGYSSLDYTEEKTVKIDKDTCGKNPVYLRWLNPLGGYDAFLFARNQDFNIDVSDRQELRRDIYRDFDDTYRFGNAEDDYIKVDAKEGMTIRSRWLVGDEADGMKYIYTSPKVFYQFATDDSDCVGDSQKVVLITDSQVTYKQDNVTLKNVEINIKMTDRIRVQGQ